MCWSMLLSVLLGLEMPGGLLDEQVAKDLKPFQGDWSAVKIRNADGSEVPKEQVEKTVLKVEGKQFTLGPEDNPVKGTFSVDATQSPHHIDVVLELPNGKEAKLLGIYVTEGATRKSCFAMPGKGRPEKIGEARAICFEWKRK